MTAGNSLTDRYDRTVRELAGKEFGGDETAARICADSMAVSLALDMTGASHNEAGQAAPEEMKRRVADILADSGDAVGTVNAILNASCACVRETAVRDAGAIYTPVSVARYMCRRAIESYLIGNLNGGQPEASGSFDELIGSSTDKEVRHARDLLDRVRLIDTSCGTGIFLEAALEELCRLKFAISRRIGNVQATQYVLARETIANNIFGLDIEPYSIKAARSRLLLRLASYGEAGHIDVRDIKMNLSRGNALLPDGDSRLIGDFDIIVGNPPYMRVKSMFRDGGADDDRKQKKESFARAVKSCGLYQCQEGNLNLYKLFIERNLSLLRENGSMCLIFPSSFLNETTSTRLRQHMFSTCDVEEIVEIPERSKLFDGVNQSTCIVTCRKGSPGQYFSIKQGADISHLDADGAIRIGLDELASMTGGRMEVPLLTSPDLEWAMLNSMRRIPPFSGNDRFPPIGDISVGNVDETIDREFVSDVPTGDIFVKGIHLNEYAVDLRPDGLQPRWVRKDAFLEKRPAAARAIASPRIIGRNTRNKASSRRLKFALLPEGYLCGNSVKQIVVTDKEIDPLYLIALLNSSVLNWYFEVFCSQNNIRNYCIEALPIPRATKQVQEAFAFVARLIMGASGEEREFLDKKLMDAMAYELYFMDMRMLSSAVLSSMEDNPSMDDSVTAGMLERQEDIQEIIDRITAREGFKIVSRTTYRL